MYLSQQCSLLPESIKAKIGEIDPPSDLDFQATKRPRDIIERAKGVVIDLGKSITFQWNEEQWPQWKVRTDAFIGEAYFDRGQYSIGNNYEALLPFKLTYHAGLKEEGSLASFALVYIGCSVR